jgi:hypothetical protein
VQIESTEFEEAGFTADQASLLMRMQRQIENTSIQRFGLQDAMNRGFAELLTSMQAGFAAVDRGFEQVDERLGRIEEHLGRPDVD